ncbi:hypothetical protein M405DRAFT_384612 [Rhizopogon salebrosus TDB-379]|nr:hypothetical protein M405DRAFT_384612 [Rhizopogon salebrosus TDB-379]
MSGTHALHALFDENKVNHTEMTAELPVREGELSKPTEAKLKSSKGEKRQEMTVEIPVQEGALSKPQEAKLKSSRKKKKKKKQGSSVVHVPVPSRIELLQKRVEAMTLDVRGMIEDMEQLQASRASESGLLLALERNAMLLGGLQREMVLNDARDILIGRYGFN